MNFIFTILLYSSSLNLNKFSVYFTDILHYYWENVKICYHNRTRFSSLSHNVSHFCGHSINVAALNITLL